MSDEIVHMPQEWSERLNISRSEARRCIATGAQSVDGIEDRRLDIPRGELDRSFVHLAAHQLCGNTEP